MTLHYQSTTKVADTGKYGFYYGNNKIDRMYYAVDSSTAQLVYRYQPYANGTQVYYASPASYNVTLQKGVYKVAIGGPKGKTNTFVFGGHPVYPGYNYGGGGGFIEIIFYNPEDQNITILAPSKASGASYVNLGGVRVMTANQGGNSGGAGGTCSYNTNTSQFDVLQVVANKQGVNGGTSLISESSVPTVSSYGNWGSSANGNGGARLEFIRRDR